MVVNTYLIDGRGIYAWCYFNFEEDVEDGSTAPFSAFFLEDEYATPF